MYTCYQVVLVAEDGEYIQEEFQTEAAADAYIRTRSSSYGEGQYLIVNPLYRGF